MLESSPRVQSFEVSTTLPKGESSFQMEGIEFCSIKINDLSEDATLLEYIELRPELKHRLVNTVVVLAPDLFKHMLKPLPYCSVVMKRSPGLSAGFALVDNEDLIAGAIELLAKRNPKRLCFLHTGNIL